jgi:hypothetical protein
MNSGMESHKEHGISYENSRNGVFLDIVSHQRFMLMPRYTRRSIENVRVVRHSMT